VSLTKINKQRKSMKCKKYVYTLIIARFYYRKILFLRRGKIVFRILAKIDPFKVVSLICKILPSKLALLLCSKYY